MSIKAARNLTINFTVPYAHSGMGIAANKELTEGMMWPTTTTARTSLSRAGAAPRPATRWMHCSRRRRPASSDDDSQSAQEVLNGNAHAFVSSYPKPTLLVHEHEDKLFLPTTDNLTQGDEAFGLRKGDPDALNFFTNWIVVNSSNGWLTDRHTYWFKTTDWSDQVDLKQ